MLLQRSYQVRYETSHSCCKQVILMDPLIPFNVYNDCSLLALMAVCNIQWHLQTTLGLEMINPRNAIVHNYYRRRFTIIGILFLELINH